MEQETGISKTTPMQLLQLAVDKGDTATIECLASLQEKFLDREAEQEFNAAMNRAQAALGRISADATNPQTKSKYATYAKLDSVVRPVYVKEGFSLSFNTAPCDKPEHVRVLCYCSHIGGHTRTYQIDIPADGKGAKGGDVMTKTHATGAADSYGKRYLLKDIFNVAIGENDNDGNDLYDNGELQEQIEWISNAKDMAELQRLFSNAYQQANKVKAQGAMRAIISAKDARKKELQCA